MKQESSKKNKKLIWLIAGLAALLVVVGVVLAIFVLPGGSGDEGPVGGRPELYWNVDRQLYIGDETSGGLSTREPAEDGLYHIRFSINGELVEYTFADKRLVNVIDNMDVMALVKDAEGNAIDALSPDTVATEVAKGFFVQGMNGNNLNLNSSIVMNGMQNPIEICELTQVYNVDAMAEVPGQIDELEMMDKVLVYSNDMGQVTHIYILERQPEAEVYWRVGKYYDSTKKETTREPDENGVYTLVFAKDGKHVELKCKDKALVDKIDAEGVEYNAPKGLQFDEEGYIVGLVDPAVALRGRLAGSEYHITEMNGNTITATYLLSGKENGKTFTVTVPEDCPIYNVCVGGSADMIGEPTELQLTDRIICYTDMEGKPILIYVVFRMVDVPVYWNITQLYNSTTKLTNRVPDGNGYYVFKMATGGKQVTLRTKDQAIASTIDSFSHFTCGLDVEGDIIKRVYRSWYVTGGDRYGVAAERFAISQTGAILSFADNVARSSYDSPTNLILSADVEIYDVTGYPGTTVGEPTTITPGDTFRLLTDYNNNITHIFVVNRYTGFPIYYNYSRSYNSATAETSRTPDADGYYVYEMASRGKTVTVKTKDKSIASVIDKQNAPIVALDVRDGIVRGAYPAVSSLECGYKTANYHLFESMTEDGTMTATISGRENEHFTFKVAKDVKIYNCSEVYNNNRGEQVSEIQYFDQIQAVATKVTGEIKEIYIMKRQAESKFYYNIANKYNSKTKETTREPNEDGYYVLDLVADGVLKQFRTKDKALASMADYYATKPFGMRVSGDIIKSVFSATSIKGVKAEIANNYDVMGVSNGKLSLTNYWPGSSNMGKSTEQTLASNYKAYDVSPYADPMGGKVKLAKGDHRIICYTNKAGEVEWVFIRYRNTHQKGYISYCEHCNKNVYWLPYTGDTYSTYGTDAHLYLASDCSYKQKTHGKLDMPESERTDAVLDLNGHTLQSTNGRCFLVYGDLTILDTVGGGKILGGMKDNEANGGAVMLGKGGNLTLLSGTLAENPESLTNTAGGVLYVGKGSTFTMRGGLVEGGTASQGGGNIYIQEATFNMTGGTVKGDILVMSPDAKINIGGKANITMGNEYGLRLAQGVILPLDGITADTKVVVDAAGVFTEKSDKIESYKANFSPSTTEFPLTVKGGALAGGLLRHCEHCDKDVYFTRYVTSECRGSSHMVMVEDKTVGEQITIGSSSRHTDDVVIDLNGHTITVTKTGDSGQATGRFALLYAKLSIMDTSAGGKGKIVSNYSSNRSAGLILASSGAVLNLYSGEITMADGVSVENSGGLIALSGYKNTETTKKDGAVMNIYGGVVSNGVAKSGGNISISEGSTLNVYGGEIKNGKTHLAIAKPLTTDKDGKVTSYSYTSGLGGNIYMSKNSKLNIGNASGETAAITGGKARIGGNVYAPAGALVTVEKTGVVSGGSTLEHRTNELDKAFVGGNIYSLGTVIVKGKVSDGTAWGGGNISIGGGSKLTIDGGVVENGVATGYPGGNIYGNNAVVELINNALVTDGVTETLYGGNISMGSGGEVYITNSTVSNGKAQTNGGNIYHAGRALKEDKNDPNKITGYDMGILVATDSVITGGVSTTMTLWSGGGNIYGSNSKVTINGTKVDLGESNQCGGNILVNKGELVIGKGSVVEGGVLHDNDDNSHIASNIGKFGSGKIEIQEGAVVTGGEGCDETIYISDTSLSDAKAIFAGKITGHLYVTSGVVAEFNSAKIDGKLTVAASAVSATVNGDTQIDVLSGGIELGELTENAKIVVSTSGIFTDKNAEKAQAYKDAGYFVSAIEGMDVVVWEEALATGLVGNCAHCNNQPTLWSAFNPKTTSYKGNDRHLVVTKDAQIDWQLNIGAKDTDHDVAVVIDLNGKTLTIPETSSSGRFALIYGKLTILDSSAEKSGTVITNMSDFRSGGLFLTQAESELNIYGGTFTMADDVYAGTGGIVYVNGNATFNMYGGKLSGGHVKPSGETDSDGVYKCGEGGNIYAKKESYVYIHGGIIENGVAEPLPLTTEEGGVVTITGYAKGFGGNIGVESKCSALTIYKDAVVTGGQAYDGGNIYTKQLSTILGTVSNGKATNNGGNIYHLGTINIGKADGSVDAKVIDGEAKNGGNIYSAWVLNIHKGATVSGGHTINGNGGNIYINCSHKVSDNKVTTVVAHNIYGTVTDGVAEGNGVYGGNIYKDGSSTLNIGKEDGSAEALITKGKAPIAGNIYVKDGATASVGGTVNAGGGALRVYKGATISYGEATSGYGGNIGLGGNKTMYLYGTVTEGTAKTMGGNIALEGGATLRSDGGTISNGTAGTTGGNINANNGHIYLREGTKVSGGIAGTDGGNIYQKAVTSNRNHEITDSTLEGGTAQRGGSICLVGEDNTKQVKFKATNSQITGGVVNLGTGAVAEINSGVIDKMTVDSSAQSVTVSGTAQVAELALPAGYKITVGEMADTADVKLSGVAVGSEISNELADPTKAPDYAKYFSVIDSDVPVGGINGKLVYGYVRACAHCNGADALFVPYTQPANRVFTENAHLILTATTNSGQITVGKCSSHGTANADCNHDVDVVIDLNDNEFISTNRTFFVYGKLSIQDTGTNPEKVGKVISNYANNTTNNGQNIQVSNGVLNLYGGEVTMAEGSAVTTGKGGIVYVTGTFNMYGGTVKGGTAGYGGNIYGYTNSIINIQGGTVTGGRGTSGGGNFYIYAGTFNLGGENTLIENGSTGGQGGNIYVSGATTINMTGGTIQNGSTDGTDYQDNVRVNSNSVMNMTGGTIYGTNGVAAGASSAINVNGSTLNIGGTASVIRADGSKDGLIGIVANANGFHILDGWTGTASFAYLDLTSNYAGVTLDTAKFACGELGTDGTFTAGGNYTGTLFYEYGDDDLAVTVVDEATGAMKIADAVVNP